MSMLVESGIVQEPNWYRTTRYPHFIQFLLYCVNLKFYSMFYLIQAATCPFLGYAHSGEYKSFTQLNMMTSSVTMYYNNCFNSTIGQDLFCCKLIHPASKGVPQIIKIKSMYV